MKNFSSFGEFAIHLAAREIEMHVKLGEGLERVAAKIEKTAQAEFGTYQPEVGPFQAWPALAPETQDERARLGYSADEPLLREGDLRDSIEHETDRGELVAVIGSTSDVMLYQELGTKFIPPRPVLGPAAIRNEKAIHRVLGAALVEGLVGGEMLDAALGYNFLTEE